MSAEDWTAPWARVERGQDWKHDCVWVDLRPIRDQVEATANAAAEQNLARAEARRRRGKRQTHDMSAGTNQRLAYQTGIAGEIAVAMLLGGKIGRQNDRHGDVRLPSGRLLEVKTAHRGYPFSKWPPRANIRRDYPPVADVVLCICDVPPFCYDRVAVVGWIPADRALDVAESTSWGWRIPYSSSTWERVEEIMQDELKRPWLPIGDPGRRSDQDPGIEAYVEDRNGRASLHGG
jgi:hypothetical protein